MFLLQQAVDPLFNIGPAMDGSVAQFASILNQFSPLLFKIVTAVFGVLAFSKLAHVLLKR
jgi:hypothetical protein